MVEAAQRSVNIGMRAWQWGGRGEGGLLLFNVANWAESADIRIHICLYVVHISSLPSQSIIRFIALCEEKNYLEDTFTSVNFQRNALAFDNSIGFQNAMNTLYKIRRS